MDTSVLGALLGLLGTPASVGVEQPSLEHFSIDPSLASGKATGKPNGGGGPTPSTALLWGLSLAILVVLVARTVMRQRRRLSRLRVVSAAPLVALAVVMTAAAAQGTLFPSSPTGATATVATATAASHAAPAAAGSQTTGSTLFNRVVAFETQIAAGQAQLASPSASQGGALLREERSLAIALESILQKEYDFYASVARDPAQAAALVRASAGQPAKVRNAVTYDVQAVQAQLAQQAAIALAARNNSATNPIASAVSPTAVSPSPPHGSQLVWPMSGVITQGFGASPFAIEPAVTLAGITYPHFHTGIDIASTFGTPVQSAADGVVALAGAETDGLGHLVGYGNYVVVAHGGDLVTLYGHLEQVLVQPGQAVHAGDPIGREGSSGNSTGPHVHFELRIHGAPINPASYVQPR